jgi:hypothetical protein
MKATDEQIIETFTRTRSYAATGRELGMHGNNVAQRVLRLRLRGVELPEAGRTFALNPELAREAGRKGGQHVRDKELL